VTLLGGKTDQLHQGFLRYVCSNLVHPQYCPVRLTRLFFGLLGPRHAGYLVARSQTGPSGLFLDGRYQLTYSRARSDLRELLRHLGYNPDSYCEHSARRGAVTSSAEAGQPPDAPTVHRNVRDQLFAIFGQAETGLK
jgi:hypothetical protein